MTVAVGSGGSALAAAYVARPRTSLGLGPTFVMTPMEFVLSISRKLDVNVASPTAMIAIQIRSRRVIPASPARPVSQADDQAGRPSEETADLSVWITCMRMAPFTP
jgi:hypothetical protein